MFFFIIKNKIKIVKIQAFTFLSRNKKTFIFWEFTSINVAILQIFNHFAERDVKHFFFIIIICNVNALVWFGLAFEKVGQIHCLTVWYIYSTCQY